MDAQHRLVNLSTENITPAAFHIIPAAISVRTQTILQIEEIVCVELPVVSPIIVRHTFGEPQQRSLLVPSRAFMLRGPPVATQICALCNFLPAFFIVSNCKTSSFSFFNISPFTVGAMRHGH